MCTNLAILTGPEKNWPISARTMDFGKDYMSIVELVPSGREFPLLFPEPREIAVLWTNQYGYIGMGGQRAISAGIKLKYFYDGMNECGLSAAGLWMPGSKYPAFTSSTKKKLYNINFVEWALGTCKDVEDARNKLANITVIDINNLDPEIHLPQHFILSDAKGKHLVVEFMNGAMQVYESDTGVMTNAPAYDWQQANMSNYVNLGIQNSAPQWWGQEVNGSGMLGLPGDATPPSRFVRASMLQRSCYETGSIQAAVGLALQILETMIVPYGTIMDHGVTEGPDADHTQWGVVRDHENRALYFFSAFNNNLYKIDLNKIDFGSARPHSIPIVQPSWYTDLTKSLTSVSSPAPELAEESI